jgi:hypothetical protein
MHWFGSPGDYDKCASVRAQGAVWIDLRENHVCVSVKIWKGDVYVQVRSSLDSDRSEFRRLCKHDSVRLVSVTGKEKKRPCVPAEIKGRETDAAKRTKNINLQV